MFEHSLNLIRADLLCSTVAVDDVVAVVVDVVVVVVVVETINEICSTLLRKLLIFAVIRGREKL